MTERKTQGFICLKHYKEHCTLCHTLEPVEAVSDDWSEAVNGSLDEPPVKKPPVTFDPNVGRSMKGRNFYDVLDGNGNFNALRLDAPNAREILQVCLDLAEFLIDKNRAYGDSAINPLRVLSKADPAEQIRVRMDDKLSRLVRGQAAGEDAMKDLVGYWILLEVALNLGAERCEDCAARGREFGTRCQRHEKTAGAK